MNIESGSNRNSAREVNTAICKLPGFISLQWLLEPHCSLADIYYLLGCLLTNQPISLPTGTIQVSRLSSKYCVYSTFFQSIFLFVHNPKLVNFSDVIFWMLISEGMQ